MTSCCTTVMTALGPSAVPLATASLFVVIGHLVVRVSTSLAHSKSTTGAVAVVKLFWSGIAGIAVVCFAHSTILTQDCPGHCLKAALLGGISLRSPNDESFRRARRISSPVFRYSRLRTLQLLRMIDDSLKMTRRSRSWLRCAWPRATRTACNRPSDLCTVDRSHSEGAGVVVI